MLSDPFAVANRGVGGVLKPGMEGQLSEQPLAELISEILEKRFSGALRVHHERVKAVIYFDGGKLIYATSNLRSFRLAEYLEKRGLSVCHIK